MSSSPLQDTAPRPSPESIVEHIRAGHPDGPEELYRFLCHTRGALWKATTSHWFERYFEDRTHDLFVALLEAIQSGRLHSPAALRSYAYNMAKRMSLSELSCHARCRRLSSLVRIDHELRAPAINAERDLLDAERRKQLEKWMRALPERDREILTRFYLNNESAEQIQAEMEIDATKYRLAKSRAKQRLQYLALKSEGKSDAYSGSASIPLALQPARAKSTS